MDNHFLLLNRENLTMKTIDEKIQEKEEQLSLSAMILSTFNSMGLDYSKLWYAIKKLETIMGGELAIFQIPPGLPEEKHKKFKLYLLEENAYTEDIMLQMFTAGISYYFPNLH